MWRQDPIKVPEPENEDARGVAAPAEDTDENPQTPEPEHATYQVEPAAEVAQAAEVAPTTAWVEYRGSADVVKWGSLRFKPGVPVEVPLAMLDEILTYPHEPFEQVKEKNDASPGSS